VVVNIDLDKLTNDIGIT